MYWWLSTELYSPITVPSLFSNIVKLFLFFNQCSELYSVESNIVLPKWPLLNSWSLCYLIWQEGLDVSKLRIWGWIILD